MPKDKINLDYETKSETDLIKFGADLYFSDPSTEIIMAAWSINGGRIEQWDITESAKPPKILTEALVDPEVENWGFNAQFERLASAVCWGLKIPYEQWRCTMVLAYMMGFAGDLALVGKAMGQPADKQKLADGKRLIRMFSCPQKPSKNQPHRWRDALTDPEEWDNYKTYNRQDVQSELWIQEKLIKFPVPQREWDLYAIDQQIVDRGVMIDHKLASNALRMGDIRKAQIIKEMAEVTDLRNPGSTAQILPWLQDRGYPFSDIQADTVKKAIREAEDMGISPEASSVLEMRQRSSKTSLAKYKTMMQCAGDDGAFRYSLQFHGAQRTGRWAGRKLQTHNLPRTPKELEDLINMELSNRLIREGDLSGLELLMGEPMDALVGCIRSALVPREGKQFRVADLSSIESVVIGWFTDCKWILNTLKANRDLYRSFAAFWLKLPYEETKPHRSKAKPATLGAGFRLGGGHLTPEGKKTGLWGYAENMGVYLTQQESEDSVNAFRDLCPEIVGSWYDLEKAAMKCIRLKQDVKYRSVVFEWRKPFMCIKLPTGRRLYYHKPQILERTIKGRNGTYKKPQITYMGKPQNGSGWVRIYTHGGKIIENIVQALAREILSFGIIRAHRDGFDIPLHVHDEIVTEQDPSDNYHTLERLIELMTKRTKYFPGLPLKAAGWEGGFYRKD